MASLCICYYWALHEVNTHYEIHLSLMAAVAVSEQDGVNSNMIIRFLNSAKVLNFA